RGQLAKMVVSAMRWQPLIPSATSFRDVPPTSPYYGYIERAAQVGVIGGYQCGGAGEPCPGLYFRPSGTSTRAQASKVVDLARRVRRTPTPARTATAGLWTATRTATFAATLTGTTTRTATGTVTRTGTATPAVTP